LACARESDRYPTRIATADLKALLDKVRRLPPDQLRQVEALVEHLESERGERPSPFRAAAGTLVAEDAVAIAKAIEDCERVEPSGW
jgi:hypothetical protein